MPNVTATPKGLLNGEIVTEFTDTTSTSTVTYTYPVQQTGIMIENSGVSDIYVTVGEYTNQLIPPNIKWKATTPYTTFYIRSDVNSQEFIATAFQNSIEDSGVADVVARALSALGLKGKDGKKYKVVACPIRNDGTGFKPIIDGVHDECNVSSATNDTTRITVNFPFTAKKINTFVAVPDEEFAKQGIAFGSSVGTNLAYIYAYKPPVAVGGYVSYNGSTWSVAAGATGNLAITSYDAGTGILTLSHDDVGALHMLSATARDDGYEPRGGSIGNVSTQIKFYNPAGTQVSIADNKMKFYLMRGATKGSTVDPNTLTTAFSNIWLFGVFEV